MEAFGVGNQTYEVININDQSLSIFKWKDWKLNLLFISLSVSSQAMIIIYIKRYRVSQVKLDETKQLFQTENNPWGQKRDLCMFFRYGNLCVYLWNGF